MASDSNSGKRGAIRLWLLIVAALVVATLIVGGATRLTESGLSIVEWKPVTGVLPPLTEAQWAAEFEKYKQIPQYRELNRGMSLAQFKTIFWWEWAHRLLGRDHRRGVPDSVPVLPVARMGRAGIARAVVAAVRRSARCRARSAGGWWRRD